jgi:hypothetical protein
MRLARTPNIAWWLYAATTLALGYGQMIRKIVSDTGGIPSRYGPPVVATIVTAGVIAWLVRRPLLRQWVWKLVFGVLVVASGVGLGFGLYLLLVLSLDSWSVVLLISGAVYLVPAEIQLYRYAFGTGVPWRSR